MRVTALYMVLKAEVASPGEGDLNGQAYRGGRIVLSDAREELLPHQLHLSGCLKKIQRNNFIINRIVFVIAIYINFRLEQISLLQFFSPHNVISNYTHLIHVKYTLDAFISH